MAPLQVTVPTMIITCLVGEPYLTFICQCYWEGATTQSINSKKHLTICSTYLAFSFRAIFLPSHAASCPVWVNSGLAIAEKCTQHYPTRSPIQPSWDLTPIKQWESFIETKELKWQNTELYIVYIKTAKSIMVQKSVSGIFYHLSSTSSHTSSH